MALISAKNFMTPFTNKVHLATISFVVILFAAFRAMGGAFSMQPVASPLGATSPGLGRAAFVAPDYVADDVEAELVSPDPLTTRPLGRLSLGDSPIVDEVEGTIRSVPREVPAARPTQENDLDEIIKRLNSR